MSLSGESASSESSHGSMAPRWSHHELKALAGAAVVVEQVGDGHVGEQRGAIVTRAQFVGEAYRGLRRGVALAAIARCAAEKEHIGLAGGIATLEWQVGVGVGFHNHLQPGFL